MTRASRWFGPACPQDPAHGAMLDWPGATSAWFCPHRKHTGLKFYNSDLLAVGQPRQPVNPLRTTSEGQDATSSSSPALRGSPDDSGTPPELGRA